MLHDFMVALLVDIAVAFWFCLLAAFYLRMRALYRAERQRHIDDALLAAWRHRDEHAEGRRPDGPLDAA